ncbi:MAG: hypothetical protein ACOX0I_02875 [Bacilli bacterium]
MKLYDLTVKDNQGVNVSLTTYQGKILLIVPTITNCGCRFYFRDYS